MRYEFVTYATGKDSAFFENVRENIPDNIKSQYIIDPRLDGEDPWVETRKIDVVKYLDNLFKIGKNFETVATIQSFFDVFWFKVPIFQYGNSNLYWRLSQCLDQVNM